MKVRIFSVIALAYALAAGPIAVASQKQDLPEFTQEGLQLLADSRLAIVYAEPGADLSGYRRVKLLEAYVAFKKDWEKNLRKSSTQAHRVSAKDMERIRTDLAAAFHEIFSARLEKGGFPVVDNADDDVLLVRPAIINLDVNAPDTMSAGRSQTYVDSAGEMTLYVELYDSVTGDLIAKALDRKVDNQHHAYYTWANRATNRAAANRILGGWADILVTALTEAHQSAVATNSAAGPDEQ
jgi:hypothetical protein